MNLLAASIPILILVIFLGFFKKPAFKVVPAALIISFLLAVIYFHKPAVSMTRAAAEGMLLALFPIIWVIIGAVFTYNLSLKTGAMEVIKNQISSVSGDARAQAILVAFGFGGFMESVAGFGTAVAIPASILISLGFNPMTAAVVCLVANSVPVAFGGLGLPVITLSNITGIETAILAKYTAVQLASMCVLVPVALAAITASSLRKAGDILPAALVSGLAYSLIQIVVAFTMGPELAAILGSIGASAVLIAYLRIFPIKEEFRLNHAEIRYEKHTMAESLQAWAPYIVLLILIAITRIPSVYAILTAKPLAMFLDMKAAAGAKPLKFDFLATPGTLLVVSAVLGSLFQKAKIREIASVFGSTIKQLAHSIVTIMSIVAMAKIMGYGGMIMIVAQAISNTTGTFYPLVAPAVGALGTFLTGSDASSNILFGQLQETIASNINANTAWIASSNTTGATAGKMISPQSLAIATTTTGMTGQEGAIFSKTLIYCLIYVAVLGLMIYAYV
ncbi:MAG: L-lactate permease [Firmicutes bacterium]|nr:L-lactate permease [Bacillota bacterium]